MEVSIEILQRCPNNCLHCSSMSDKSCRETIDYSKFVEVIKDVAKLGAKTICISGGEPFLHEKIVEMVDFVASMGLQVYIYTSGIILDGQGNFTSLEKEVLANISTGVTKLIFNIEAADSVIYDEIMGTVGCFELMKQSVLIANDLFITTEAHFVPMKLNYTGLAEVIDLCKELHISKLSLLRLVLQGRALDNKAKISLSREELLNFRLSVVELKDRGLDIRVGVPLTTGSVEHRCTAVQGKLNIRYDGYVFPCEAFKGNHLKLFSGIKPESIWDKNLIGIYEKSEYLRIVRELLHEFKTNECCETCIGQYLANKE